MRCTLTLILLLAQAASAQYTFEGAYPALQKALQPTPEQAKALIELNQNWSRHQFAKVKRLQVVYREIDAERTRPELRPYELGIRYYEVAAICQEGVSRFAEYRAAVRTLLTPSQQQTLAQLESSAETLTLHSDAHRLHLIDSDLEVTKGESALNPDIVGCESFIGRIYFSAETTVVPSRPSSPLEQYLELTATQKTALNAVHRVNALALNELEDEAYDLQSDFRTFARRPNPQPNLLGLDLERLEKNCRMTEQLLQMGVAIFRQQLTPAQRAKLEDLERLAKLLPVLHDASVKSVVSTMITTPTERVQWRLNSTHDTSITACSRLGPQPPTVIERIISTEDLFPMRPTSAP